MLARIILRIPAEYDDIVVSTAATFSLLMNDDVARGTYDTMSYLSATNCVDQFLE